MTQFWHFYFPNVIGLIGVTFILLSYFLLQIGRWNNRSLSFSLTNLIASLMIMYSLTFFWNFSSFVIEIFWCVISLIGILRACQRYLPTRKASKQTSAQMN